MTNEADILTVKVNIKDTFLIIKDIYKKVL